MPTTGVTSKITSAWHDRPMLTYRPELGRNDRVVRLSVTVPIEVDADAWELAYGTGVEGLALMRDIRAHVTATIAEAVTAALAAQANGASILTSYRD